MAQIGGSQALRNSSERPGWGVWAWRHPQTPGSWERPGGDALLLASAPSSGSPPEQPGTTNQIYFLVFSL